MCWGIFYPNFAFLGILCSPYSKKWPKYGPFMAKTWYSHGFSNWFFLMLNQCAQGCSMQNFTVLASILTDIFSFVTQLLRPSVAEWDVEMCTWPEAKGKAKNLYNKIKISQKIAMKFCQKICLQFLPKFAPKYNLSLAQIMWSKLSGHNVCQ